MLYISVGPFTDDCIVNVKETFDYRKKPEWFAREDVRKFIMDIDKTEVIDGECLRSPILGVIAPERLSTGCKALILMMMYRQYKVYATRCGDNCAPDILDIASRQDLHIVLHHVMEFPEPFEAVVEESGVLVHSMEEFINEYYKFRD